MRWVRFAFVAGVFASFPFTASAADLKKIDRTIAKQPAYKSRPKYCLLVFGPEAKARNWIVVDGDALYVDRNGNGDLTEPSNRVQPKDTERFGVVFEAGDVHEGRLLHTGLRVTVGDFSAWTEDMANYPEYKQLMARDPQARSYSVVLDVAMPGVQGPGPGGRVRQAAGFFDADGLLQFADRPEDAPVIHFRGPWAMSMPDRQRMTAGETSELFVHVGTPGFGPGTFASASYKGLIPENASPALDIVFPPQKPGRNTSARSLHAQIALLRQLASRPRADPRDGGRWPGAGHDFARRLEGRTCPVAHTPHAGPAGGFDARPGSMGFQGAGAGRALAHDPEDRGQSSWSLRAMVPGWTNPGHFHATEVMGREDGQGARHACRRRAREGLERGLFERGLFAGWADTRLGSWRRKAVPS